MNKLDSSRLKGVFESTQRFGEKELQILREDCALVGQFSSKADYIEMRMVTELIDAIARLDTTSTRLIRTTNRLTGVILALTVVGVVLAALQFFKAS